jgi:hypothetical protein
VFQEKYPGVPVLYVDAGDFTGDPTVPGQRQTDALIEAMNQMGYKVAALGLRELAQGWEPFAARRAKAKFPFVSANIVWQDTAEPVVDPFVIVSAPLRPGTKAKEVRIAFTGVTMNNPAFLKSGSDGRTIVTIDPVEAAAKVVPRMREKADIVVVLSSIDLEKSRALARRSKEVDLILGGLGAAQSRPDDFPEDSLIGRTRIQSIGDQGKNLGEVRLTFKDGRALGTVQRAVVGLTRDWPDQPEMAGLMAATRESINDYHRAQAEAANPFATQGTPAPPAPAATATYTGSERCQPCHEAAFATWAKSSHARAFEILVSNKQDYNPRCVGCHVVGYGRPGGFLNAGSTPRLVHVGCEACHGPSSRHPDTVGAGYGATTTDACRTCHTPENSPDFNPSTYIPKVRHWDEARAAR